MYSPNDREQNGESYIPASQRPDGTWRKARRVKEGYVPQEEVPLYESKGKQCTNRLAKTEVILPYGVKAQQPIPGLFIIEDKEKVKTKKKSKGANADEIANAMQQIKLVGSSVKPHSDRAKSELPVQNTDPVKRLKNLKKRLREVESLEVKLKEGAIPKPEPDQLAKLQRKNDLLLQICELEKVVCS